MKLVVIEDDESYCALIRYATEGLVDEFQTFSSWEQAKPVIGEANVLWLDLSTRGMEPEEVPGIVADTRALNDDLVIVVASGYLSEERRQDLEQAGVDFVSDKDNRVQPVQIASLILLGLMKAKKRSSAKSVALLLDRALGYMRDRFPDAIPA